MSRQCRLTETAFPASLLPMSSHSPSLGHESTQLFSQRPTRAVVLVLLSTVLYSLVPLLVHYLALDLNPFIFNAIAQLALGGFLYTYVQVTAAKYFKGDLVKADGSPQETITPTEVLGFTFGHSSIESRSAKRRAIIRSVLGRQQSEEGQDDETTHATAVEPQNRIDGGLLQKLRMSMPFLWLPIFWMIVSRIDYGLFILSSRYVETAVTTAIFEVWPIVMVLTLAAFDSRGTYLRSRTISTRKRTLMVLAFSGLAIVVLSQGTLEIHQIFRTSSIIGIVLAALGGALTGISPAAGIRYGDLVFGRFTAAKARIANAPSDEAPTDREFESDSPAGADSATADEREPYQNLWFALVGLAGSCAIVVPLNILLALVVPTKAGSIWGGGYMWILAAIGLGTVALGFGTVALRQANLDARDLGVNSLYFITPILALLWLSIAGIALQRADLLWIGAVLVFSMNGLIESNPDDEPDYDKLDSERPWGTRLGFTSLILSLWCFGSIVYLRDEIYPASWLSWEIPEYWSLVALSATVFALIYGFRVARLTTRLVDEDKQMLRAFRKFERLVGEGILPATLARRFATS